MANIGKRVARLREEKGWSQLELAQRMKVDNSVISKIEKETRKVSSDELDRFATIFGVSADTLLGRKTTDHGDSGSEPSQENKHVDETVEQALSHVMSFDGKPVTDHDRAILQQIAEAYLKGRDPDEDNQ